MAAPSDKLLMNIDFPVFVIKSISPKHFLIGGGGGPSATGVPNGLEIVELVSDSEKGIFAKPVCKFDSGKYSIMNCGLRVDDHRRVHIACGHDDKCYIYMIKQKTVTLKSNSPGTEESQLRKRKSGLTNADGFKNAKKIVTFDVQLVDSVTTDFHNKDPYQNCAAFTADGNSLVTGGADGFIRRWKFPELSKEWERKAHESEIEALQTDPKNTQICTTSKDRKLLLWNASNGKELAELKWASEPSIKYKHKACKYCYVDNDPAKLCLFSIEVPVAHKKGAACYISQWNVNKYQPICVQPIYCGTLSCMDISECGKYLAVGSMEGDVAVYDTTQLKCVYHKRNSHKTFVTGLSFSPASYLCHLITNECRFSLVSISIDNQVKLHQPAKPSWRRYKVLVLLLLFFIWICLVLLGSGYGNISQFITTLRSYQLEAMSEPI